MSKKTKAKPAKRTAVAVVPDPKPNSQLLRISNLQAIATEQSKLIDRIHEEAALRCVLLGRILREIKDGLAHGQWGPWLKSDFAGSQSKANQVMRLSVEIEAAAKLTKVEKLALPANATVDLAVQPEDAAARSAFAKMQKLVAGKSFRDLLDEYGIMEKAKLGGARTKGGDAATPPMDGEQLYLFAMDEIGGAIMQAETLLIKENRLQHLVGHPNEIRAVVESLRAMADKVEKAASKILKAEKPDAPAPKPTYS